VRDLPVLRTDLTGRVSLRRLRLGQGAPAWEACPCGSQRHRDRCHLYLPAPTLDQGARLSPETWAGRREALPERGRL
jgi:hypothetical protein